MIMKKILTFAFAFIVTMTVIAQSRRPIDNHHPMWMIHIDVWNNADPQKIIDLVPKDILPFVCFNLSLSCQFDKEKDIYKMPENGVMTFDSWATVCCQNNVWFTCQPASGGHTHIMDSDLETLERFFKDYKNFLGWNYCEQFWGFDEAGDRSSSTQEDRVAMFAKLVRISHNYGGFLTVSYCGNIWSHSLSPVGMLKRNADFMTACREHPEAILFLYKYTQPWSFYNTESVCLGPWIAGLTTNYGIRYDQCGWEAAGNKCANGEKTTYPNSVGISTVMEQTAINGACVWDGPELIWQECFKSKNNTTSSGYTRRNWTTFDHMDNIWVDMFRKIIDGTIYIPSREEVIKRTKIAVVNNVKYSTDNSFCKVNSCASTKTLYDGLYKQDNDPVQQNGAYYMDELLHFKKTGRYQAIPVLPCAPVDELGQSIPLLVNQSQLLNNQKWSTEKKKVADFDNAYDKVSEGHLFVARNRNQMVMYYPFSCWNKIRVAQGIIPLKYNTCEKLIVDMARYSGAIVNEHADGIDIYLNNYRSDSLSLIMTDTFTVVGASAEPIYILTNRGKGSAKTPSVQTEWDESTKSFKMAVTHMGPLDLTISCKGAATDRLTDFLDLGPLTDLPVQPTDTIMPITIEAENMDYQNIGQLVTDAYYQAPDVRGHSAMGFVKMGTNTTAALRDYFVAPVAGKYTISIKYQATTAGARLTFLGAGTHRIKLEPTSGNTEWKQALIEDVTLKAGKNILTYKNTGGKDINIDCITYIPSESLTAIEQIRQQENVADELDAIYSPAGMRISHLQPGLNILRMKSGRTVKVIHQ